MAGRPAAPPRQTQSQWLWTSPQLQYRMGTLRRRRAPRRSRRARRQQWLLQQQSQRLLPLPLPPRPAARASRRPLTSQHIPSHPHTQLSLAPRLAAQLPLLPLLSSVQSRLQVESTLQGCACAVSFLQGPLRLRTCDTCINTYQRVPACINVYQGEFLLVQCISDRGLYQSVDNT